MPPKIQAIHRKTERLIFYTPVLQQTKYSPWRRRGIAICHMPVFRLWRTFPQQYHCTIKKVPINAIRIFGTFFVTFGMKFRKTAYKTTKNKHHASLEILSLDILPILFAKLEEYHTLFPFLQSVYFLYSAGSTGETGWEKFLPFGRRQRKDEK